MAAGGSFDVMAEKEANMEGTKKMRGAWVIRVKVRNSGKGVGAGHNKCNLGSGEDIPCYDKHKNSTTEKGE